MTLRQFFFLLKQTFYKNLEDKHPVKLLYFVCDTQKVYQMAGGFASVEKIITFNNIQLDKSTYRKYSPLT